MSKMNELYEKVAKDEALQAELAEIMKGATADKAVEIKEKLVAFAKRQGFDVSIDEISAFFGGMAQASAELSETELDAVAGGKSEEGKTNVFISVISLGTVCAISSIIQEVEYEGCSEFYQ